jgi:hypothetical protein
MTDRFEINWGMIIALAVNAGVWTAIAVIVWAAFR